MTATPSARGMLVVIARWFMDLVVFFVTSYVHCTTIIDYELIVNFSSEKKYKIIKFLTNENTWV